PDLTDPPDPGPDRSAEWVVAEVLELADGTAEARLSTELPAVLEAELGVPVATWRTEPAVNDFPSLPVRDVRSFVWLAVLADRAADRIAPPAPGPDRSAGWVVAEVLELADGTAEARLSTELPAVLEAELGVPVATWRTEPAVNDFPSLPVRDVRAFVWLAVLADRA